MPTIRQLIEHLDVSGEYCQFALDAEQFGDDLVQAWTGIENGAHLLWLAAAVGVEPKKIIATACDLLGEVFEQIETAGQETAQVLEAVHAWQRGERSADEVDRSGWDAYGLIARMGDRSPLAPDAEEVADAAVWLTSLVRDLPPSLSPDLAEHDQVLWCGSAWMMVDCLAQALASHQSPDDPPPGERQHAFEKAMCRFAILIREHIVGTEVQTAAQQRGAWPLC
ncbi:MAG: hypothetical protein JO011_13040 [Ktedonobacteraceae bacterium]|nr:hypothetical protein [Ktedonobacteraceae bacterium]